MKNSKSDILQFFVWMRNGISFCTSWFLILWLLYNHFGRIDYISTDDLIQMLLFVVGGVFIFSAVFTRMLVKKWSFLARLSCFMILISIYECGVFYCAGIWSGSGAVLEWLGFIGLILISYLLCITIYHRYSKRKGELYTQALQKYQHQRRSQYEK